MSGYTQCALPENDENEIEGQKDEGEQILSSNVRICNAQKHLEVQKKIVAQ